MSLGACFYQGKGVPLDYYEAATWFRKAAEQGHSHAQCSLGWCYHEGNGVAKDYGEAVKWFRKAAENDYPDGQLLMGMAYASGEGVATNHNEAAKLYRKAAERGHGTAQLRLGVCYFEGKGVRRDEVEAVRWLQKAAEKGVPIAQSTLGMCYISGQGVREDWNVGVKWLRKAAEQGNVTGQGGLGLAYFMGQGVPEDYVEAYKWFNLAAAQGDTNTLAFREQSQQLCKLMTPDQVAEGQRRASAFQPRLALETANEFVPSSAAMDFAPTSSGTGFFITEDGFLVTNEHVVKAANEIRLVTSAGLIDAKVVTVDEANDLALLKAVGSFRPLPITSSRSVKMGSTVSTVGFPNINLQGFAPKFAKGEIAALSGANDDPKYFQISVPVQPGNSGGALLDERGNVVGVVSAKLSVREAIAKTGEIPENVNYAVKSSLLLSFLESVPDVSATLKEPNSNSQKFEDVVHSAERAAVLVLCRTPSKVASVLRVPTIPNFQQTPPSAATAIESQIDGDFEGWEGETIVKLTNGQIWQQTEYYYHYHYAFMPGVLVYRSGAGYKMKVDGIDRAVGVTQLK
jgi:TPR repeat protein